MDEFERMVNDLREDCERMGLVIRIEKTKVICNSEENCEVKISGFKIENEDVHKYLDLDQLKCKKN